MCTLEMAQRAQAKNDVRELAAGVVAFEAEYGRWPGTGKQVVGGEMLAALTGSNNEINPRGIRFVET